MREFRRVVLGLAAGAAVAFAATGADANGRRSIKDGPYEHPFSWTGFYVGAHAGVAFSDIDWTFTNPVDAEPIRHNASAFGGGLQAGYQQQWGSTVAGIEVSYTWTNLEETTPSEVADRSRTSEVSDLLLVTARLGYAMDRWLAYAKGGYASAEVEFRSSVTSTGALTTSSSGREHGWTIGAGLEYALTRNVSIGIEYNFIHLNVDTRQQTTGPAGVPGSEVFGVDADIHTVMARLNYRFGN